MFLFSFLFFFAVFVGFVLSCSRSVFFRLWDLHGSCEKKNGSSDSLDGRGDAQSLRSYLPLVDAKNLSPNKYEILFNLKGRNYTHP